MNTQRDDQPLFSEAAEAQATAPQPWKILVADDQEEVHAVTKLVLASTRFHNRPAQLLHAYSGEQAVKLMRDNPDVALVLMDVVMESDSAGLDAARTIREELGNGLVRIAVRTGQPGTAPEHKVVTQYGIDDYREKTELTATRLFTLVHTSLAHYEQLRTLEYTRAGLRKVLDATAAVFKLPQLPLFADGVLLHLIDLLWGDRARPDEGVAGFAAVQSGERPLRIVAGAGLYTNCLGRRIDQLSDPIIGTRIEHALRQRAGGFDPHHFLTVFRTHEGDDVVLYVTGASLISADNLGLALLFCRNVTAALESRQLQLEKERTESEMVVTLSEAIEARSRETGNHVRRVAEYSRLLARLAGLDTQTCHLLYLSAPLHDAGKIGIPDAVLHKPGQHTEAETTVMQTHAEIGRQIFTSHDSPVLQAAAVIAGQHHERWDGKGYPGGLKGEDIHIFGRITAIADVFDALTHARCYKEAWPLSKALDYIVQERGTRFDPALVDLFMQNLDQFIEIHNRLSDPSLKVH